MAHAAHQPRSRHRRVRLRAHLRHVCGPDDRMGLDRGRVRDPGASLYGRACCTRRSADRDSEGASSPSPAIRPISRMPMRAAPSRRAAPTRCPSATRRCPAPSRCAGGRPDGALLALSAEGAPTQRGRGMTRAASRAAQRLQDLQARAQPRPSTRCASVSLTVAAGRDRRTGRRKRLGQVDAGAYCAGLLEPDGGRVLLDGRSLYDLRGAEFAPCAPDAAGLPGRHSGPQSAPHGARAPVAGVGCARGRRRSCARSRFSTAWARPGPNTSTACRMSCPAASGSDSRSLARLPSARADRRRRATLGGGRSIRGQILNLLLDIKQARGIAYVLITHDISVARAFADRVAVMMRGEIVETAQPATYSTNPVHEYTRRLLAAVPALPARSSPIVPELPR